MGAIVRFALFWVGLILILLTFFGGIFGLVIWLLIPLVGLAHWIKYNKRLVRFIERLLFKLKAGKTNALTIIFENEAGKFVLAHTQLDIDELIKNANQKNLNVSKIVAKSYEDIITKLVKNRVWSKDFFRKKGVVGDDLILAASWWDKKRREESQLEGPGLGKPGIGLELLFARLIYPHPSHILIG